MSEPRTADEYVARYTDNTVIDGFGPLVTLHFPCPFCAARDFRVVQLLEFDKPGDGHCAECGRSGRFVIEHEPGGGTQMEFVQTGGADPPEWLTPAPRRVQP